MESEFDLKKQRNQSVGGPKVKSNVRLKLTQVDELKGGGAISCTEPDENNNNNINRMVVIQQNNNSNQNNKNNKNNNNSEQSDEVEEERAGLVGGAQPMSIDPSLCHAVQNNGDTTTTTTTIVNNNNKIHMDVSSLPSTTVESVFKLNQEPDQEEPVTQETGMEGRKTTNNETTRISSHLEAEEQSSREDFLSSSSSNDDDEDEGSLIEDNQEHETSEKFADLRTVEQDQCQLVLAPGESPGVAGEVSERSSLEGSESTVLENNKAHVIEENGQQADLDHEEEQEEEDEEPEQDIGVAFESLHFDNETELTLRSSRSEQVPFEETGLLSSKAAKTKQRIEHFEDQYQQQKATIPIARARQNSNSNSNAIQCQDQDLERAKNWNLQEQQQDRDQELTDQEFVNRRSLMLESAKDVSSVCNLIDAAISDAHTQVNRFLASSNRQLGSNCTAEPPASGKKWSPNSKLHETGQQSNKRTDPLERASLVAVCAQAEDQEPDLGNQAASEARMTCNLGSIFEANVRREIERFENNSITLINNNNNKPQQRLFSSTSTTNLNQNSQLQSNNNNQNKSFNSGSTEWRIAEEIRLFNERESELKRRLGRESGNMIKSMQQPEQEVAICKANFFQNQDKLGSEDKMNPNDEQGQGGQIMNMCLSINMNLNNQVTAKDTHDNNNNNINNLPKRPLTNHNNSSQENPEELESIVRFGKILHIPKPAKNPQLISQKAVDVKKQQSTSQVNRQRNEATSSDNSILQAKAVKLSTTSIHHQSTPSSSHANSTGSSNSSSTSSSSSISMHQFISTSGKRFLCTSATSTSSSKAGIASNSSLCNSSSAASTLSSSSSSCSSSSVGSSVGSHSMLNNIKQAHTRQVDFKASDSLACKETPVVEPGKARKVIESFSRLAADSIQQQHQAAPSNTNNVAKTALTLNSNPNNNNNSYQQAKQNQQQQQASLISSNSSSHSISIPAELKIQDELREMRAREAELRDQRSANKHRQREQSQSIDTNHVTHPSSSAGSTPPNPINDPINNKQPANSKVKDSSSDERITAIDPTSLKNLSSEQQHNNLEVGSLYPIKATIDSFRKLNNQSQSQSSQNTHNKIQQMQMQINHHQASRSNHINRA